MDSVEEHRHLGRISFSGGRVMKSDSESVTVVYECRSATIPTPTAALPLLLSHSHNCAPTQTGRASRWVFSAAKYALQHFFLFQCEAEQSQL